MRSIPRETWILTRKEWPNFSATEVALAAGAIGAIVEWMADQPTGTVTMLFTDIEGSTRLLQDLGQEQYSEALDLHRRLLRHAFERHGGVEGGYGSDSFFVAVRRAGDALGAAAGGQQALVVAEVPG